MALMVALSGAALVAGWFAVWAGYRYLSSGWQ